MREKLSLGILLHLSSLTDEGRREMGLAGTTNQTNKNKRDGGKKSKEKEEFAYVEGTHLCSR